MRPASFFESTFFPIKIPFSSTFYLIKIPFLSTFQLTKISFTPTFPPSKTSTPPTFSRITLQLSSAGHTHSPVILLKFAGRRFMGHRLFVRDMRTRDLRKTLQRQGFSCRKTHPTHRLQIHVLLEREADRTCTREKKYYMKPITQFFY